MKVLLTKPDRNDYDALLRQVESYDRASRVPPFSQKCMLPSPPSSLLLTFPQIMLNERATSPSTQMVLHHTRINSKPRVKDRIEFILGDYTLSPLPIPTEALHLHQQTSNSSVHHGADPHTSLLHLHQIRIKRQSIHFRHSHHSQERLRTNEAYIE